MVIHQIKPALRNLFRQKTNSLINLLGLAAAFAACLLAFFWLRIKCSMNRSLPECEGLRRMKSQEIRSTM